MGLNFRIVNQNKHDVFSDGNITYQRTIVLHLLAFVDACFLRFDELAIWRQSLWLTIWGFAMDQYRDAAWSIHQRQVHFVPSWGSGAYWLSGALKTIYIHIFNSLHVCTYGLFRLCVVTKFNLIITIIPKEHFSWDFKITRAGYF